MIINNNFFFRFQKINYILPDLSSQFSNSSQYSDSNQGEAGNRGDSIYTLETEIANLQKTQDLLFFGKFLLTCATVITPLIMGLIYYFNPNSLITIPIIAGVGGGCLGSLVLLCGFDKYNSNKIAKKNQQKSLLGQNIFDQGRGLFQGVDRFDAYLVNDQEDHQISSFRSSFDQREHSSAVNSDVVNNQDKKASEENPSSDFNDAFNPANGQSPSPMISNRRGLGPHAVDVSDSLTNGFQQT
ncbi:MAG: hypothetical protein RL769_311 [Pseudomonadota bacterium]